MPIGSNDSVSGASQKDSWLANWSTGKPFRENKPALIVGALIMALVIALVAWERENIFTIDVSTETVALSVTDPVLSQWSLGEAILLEEPFAEVGEGTRLEKYTLLMIEPGAEVRLQRHGTERIRIQLTAGTQGSVGRIETPDGRRIGLGDWALLLVDVAGRPLVFPFRGTLMAGDDVAVGVDSILLGGTVTVVEEQLLGKTHYIAGGETLDPGDRVQLWRETSAQSGAPEPATVSGFVRAEAQEGFSEPANAFTLVAHGQANYVAVERLGSAGYHIRAPHWARFLHDPLLAATTAIIALLALLLEVLSKCSSVVKPRPSDGEHERVESSHGSKSASGDDAHPEETSTGKEPSNGGKGAVEE